MTPQYDRGGVTLYVGHVLDVLRELPSESVQSVVTSPPYFGLRAYGTEPQTWDEAEGCEHAWEPFVKAGQSGGTASPKVQIKGAENFQTTPDQQQATCKRCAAWRGELGSEPTPALFVAHLVEIFAEVRRVLRPDGLCFVVIGDSYAGSGKGPTGYNGIGDQAERQGFVGTKRGPSSILNQDGTGGRQARAPACPGTPRKSLLLVPERLAIALSDDGWILRSRIAWCLSGGAMLYVRSQKGDMPMSVKDMARLDPKTLQLWNGEKWTNVKAVWENPAPADPIEIELRSGERIGCTPEHRWPTQRGLVTTRELRVGDVLATTRLPEPALPRSPKALDDESVGWFVGLYLAEGSLSHHAIHIASHIKETERFERCQAVAQAFDGSATWRPTRGNGATITVYGRILRAILEEYISGYGAKSKRLSNACWRRSNVFLRGLLDGYLHGDGHWDEKNRRWRLSFTRNYYLAADFRTLCARLGVHLRLRPRFATMNGRSLPSFRGEIRFEKSGSGHEKPDGEIVSIGWSRGRKFWDIEVEDEPHLFALASGVLTHNCKRSAMPESVRDRPSSAWEHIWMLSKSGRYYWDADAVREPYTLSSWTAQREMAGELARGKDGLRSGPKGAARAIGAADGQQSGRTAFKNGGYTQDGRNMRNVWLLSPDPYPQAHFATFPREIPRRCILAATKPGDVVLDPFAGSGTTLLVAKQLERRAIGIELNAAYAALATDRLNQDVLPLFAAREPM